MNISKCLLKQYLAFFCTPYQYDFKFQLTKHNLAKKWMPYKSVKYSLYLLAVPQSEVRSLMQYLNPTRMLLVWIFLYFLLDLPSTRTNTCLSRSPSDAFPRLPISWLLHRAALRRLEPQVEVYLAPEILLGSSLAGEDYTPTLLERATWLKLLV